MVLELRLLFMDMKFELDHWTPYGNILVGYIYGHPKIPNKSRIFSGAILYIDEINNEAVTLSQKSQEFLKFKLKDKGTIQEHINNPVIEKQEVKDTMFLNPRG